MSNPRMQEFSDEVGEVLQEHFWRIEMGSEARQLMIKMGKLWKTIYLLVIDPYQYMVLE